ncbi:hypothetical protein MPB2EB_0416 [Mycoavidus sp. B2-EB]|nr:hypothetical protein MPB2EB_0416 [Mycoavidus sp. B2-EB]
MYCLESYPSPPKYLFSSPRVLSLKQCPKKHSANLQHSRRSPFSFKKLAPSLCAFYFHFTDLAQVQSSIEVMIKPKAPHLPLIRPTPPFSTPYRPKRPDSEEYCEAALASKQSLIR